MKKKRLAKAGLVVLALGLSLTACSSAKFNEQFQDAPVGTTNETPADLIRMPDGFSNVGTKCDGPNRVYVLFHDNSAYGSVAVAPNDPRCKS